MTENNSPVIEIRDPALDGPVIARLVQQQAMQRRAQNAQSVDWAALVPGLLQPGIAASDSDAATDFPGLRESLAELIGRGHLNEPSFQSAMPILGPAIVAVRRAWNWVSTKWYVRPIMAQQSDVNARASRTISDLAQWHEMDARRLSQLEKRLAELEARLARVEAEDRS
jgi:hypothetical protein